MNWGSLSEFIAMGGYGGYVWGSFGAAAAVFAVEFALVRQRRAAIVRTLRRQVIAGKLEEEFA